MSVMQHAAASKQASERTMFGTFGTVAERVRALAVFSSLGTNVAPSWRGGSAGVGTSGMAPTADRRSTAVLLIVMMALKICTAQE